MTKRSHCLRSAQALLSLLALLVSAPARAQDNLLRRNLAATCAGCHGTNGQARGEMKPLAGLPAQVISARLSDFRSGAAAATVMHQIAKGYSEEQLALIAAHFASQPVASR